MNAPLLLTWAAGLLLPCTGAPEDEGKKEDPLKTLLVAQEKRAWEILKTEKVDPLRELQTPGYREIGGPADGRIPLFVLVKREADLKITGYTMENPEVVPLGKEAALLTYVVRVRGVIRGRALPDRSYFLSSAYTKRGDKWLCELRQWTVVPEVGLPPPLVQGIDVTLAPEGGLRCNYRGLVDLRDVKIEVSVTFRDGASVSQIRRFWANWEPGSVKIVELTLLTTSLDLIETVELTGLATREGKPVALYAISRRQR